MNVALRAVWEALGSSDEAPSGWRELMLELRIGSGATRIGYEDVADSLRALDLGAGSTSEWLAHLRNLGVLNLAGEPDEARAESVATALELVGDSFRPLGEPTGWALVATLPRELRALLNPPPVRHTGGVMLELIDRATSELVLAAPYADDAGIAHLVSALVAAGRRGANVSVVTSTGYGRMFSNLARAWPTDVSGDLRVTEVATHLSPLGSHEPHWVSWRLG